MKNENKKETSRRQRQEQKKQIPKVYIAIIAILVVLISVVVFGLSLNAGKSKENLSQLEPRVEDNMSNLFEEDEDEASSEEEVEEDSTSAEASSEASSAEEPSESTEATEEEIEEVQVDQEALNKREQQIADFEAEHGIKVVDTDNPEAKTAFQGDWDPIGTSQTGEHVTTYSEGSADRVEITTAAAAVTGLNPNSMIEHWVGNDGTTQGVYATVSDLQQTEKYRVHLRWQDGQGWQPLTVEILE